ncbi:hypothetical protein MGI18_24295 [Bacillus sp. OVS6]|nr:hypothetical protein MGI18_24295 [Bacillus sp. OVS6]
MPEIDSSQFVHSASQTDGLLTDAKKLTTYLSTSKEQTKRSWLPLRHPTASW